MDNVWTEEWPTEEGYYWLYGYRWTPDEGDEMELHFVEVMEISGGDHLYIFRGNTTSQQEGGYGLWTKAQLPELPEDNRPAST